MLAALLSACAGDLGETSQAGDTTLAAYRSPAQAPARATAAKTERRYFIEFRARTYPPFGHTYMIYGTLDRNGNPLESNYIGFTPKGGAAGYAAGSSPAFVPGTLEPLEGDFNMTPLTSYRHSLEPGQYADLLAFDASAREESHWWNLYLNNCNSFAAEMARAAGISAPIVPTVVPMIFVSELRDLNENM